MINVTKTFLPPFEEYVNILRRAWDKAWITNNGELVVELEMKLSEYLNVPYLLFTGNGTAPIQMALKAYGITNQVITTPFSYVATTSSILWEGCTPVFVDIEQETFCIDPDKIEAAITENTEAILATHVYGYPCNVEKIKAIAEKHNLKVIYDGAHAFGCIYKGKSLLSYGDISTCSFHATKVFHTVEGGCIISHDKELNHQLALYRSFGHMGDDYYTIGINAKNSEFHAAMGLALLPKISKIIESRKQSFQLYNELLPVQLRRPDMPGHFQYNYSYYPVIFENEKQMQSVKTGLEKEGIFTRRYFFPSLNRLPYLEGYEACPISEEITSKVLCLPIYPELPEQAIRKINGLIRQLI